jgi:hypothetical protein
VAVNSAYVRNGTSDARDSLDERFLSFFRFLGQFVVAYPRQTPSCTLNVAQKQQQTAKNR